MFSLSEGFTGLEEYVYLKSQHILICSSKDKQAFIIKRDRDGYNFDLEASRRENLILVLSLLSEGKHENL